MKQVELWAEALDAGASTNRSKVRAVPCGATSGVETPCPLIVAD
ncbi:MAG: hypothetical protein ACRDTE_00355 [Pseudonocardiaceae bacterium]